MMTALPKELLQRIDQEPGLVAAFLHGSYAKGGTRPGSDIDLAILFQPHRIPDSLAIWNLQCELNNFLPTDIDLVCLNHAGTRLRWQVLQYGKPLIMKDQLAYDSYVMQLVKEHDNYQTICGPIEQALVDNLLRRHPA